MDEEEFYDENFFLLWNIRRRRKSNRKVQRVRQAKHYAIIQSTVCGEKNAELNVERKLHTKKKTFGLSVHFIETWLRSFFDHFSFFSLFIFWRFNFSSLEHFWLDFHATATAVIAALDFLASKFTPTHLVCALSFSSSSCWLFLISISLRFCKINFSCSCNCSRLLLDIVFHTRTGVTFGTRLLHRDRLARYPPWYGKWRIWFELARIGKIKNVSRLWPKTKWSCCGETGRIKVAYKLSSVVCDWMKNDRISRNERVMEFRC